MTLPSTEPSTEKLLSCRGRLQGTRHWSDELIEDSRRRIVAHLKLLAQIRKHDGRQFANWNVLQQNLEAGRTLPITQREMIVRELAYTDRERLRNDAICASPDTLPASPAEIA